MKTTNVRWIGDCPAWKDDLLPGQLAEFKALLARVHQDILGSAARILVTPEDVRQWHATLFSPFVPITYYAGNYRGMEHAKPCLAKQVKVGSAPGLDYRLVREYLSVHFDQIRGQLSQLELQWANLTTADRTYQLAIVTANLIGGFIQIHPFINGNGRTSRLLWRWSLLRFGVPPQCCTYPRPISPYSQVMKAAMQGDYRPLVLYVLGHLYSHAPSLN